MLLYHGSNMAIVEIDLDKCKPFKDFGRGFYLTTIEEQALLMAGRTSRIFSGLPTVTTFTLDEKALSAGTLSIKRFDEPTLEWALFVLNNRNRNFTEITNKNCNQDNKYDIVVGPIANDDIALLLRTYTRGYIDGKALLNGMRYKKLNNQYAFHTMNALPLLKREEAKTYE